MAKDRTSLRGASRTCLIDGDMIAYRFSYSADSIDQIKTSIRSFVWDIKYHCHASRSVMFLSGKHDFRRRMFPEYKANRENQPKPPLLRDAKAFIYNEMKCECHPSLEADDLIGLRATDGSYENPIMVSGDKDQLCVPGWHYQPFRYSDDNPGSQFPFRVTVEQASAYLFCQLLSGDKTDGIPGLEDVGAASALRLLAAGECVRGLKGMDPKDACDLSYTFLSSDRSADSAINAARFVYNFFYLEEQFEKILPQIAILRRPLPEQLLDYPEIKALIESIPPLQQA